MTDNQDSTELLVRIDAAMEGWESGPDAMTAGPSLTPLERLMTWTRVLSAVLERRPRIYAEAERHAPEDYWGGGRECQGCDEPWPCGAFRRAADLAGERLVAS